MIQTIEQVGTRAGYRAWKRGLAATVAGAALLVGAGAQAQSSDSAQAPRSEDTKEGETPDVIVTGSQVARTGFVSATPLTTLSTEQIERTGLDNIGDALNQLPALRATLTPSSATNLFSMTGGNFLDLRGLGAVRTLTLVDGKRYVPTNPSGIVNTNVIPQAMIASTDIVTGGASAAYGSDAVAGVVNLRLRPNLQGVTGSIQGSITDHNDNRRYRLSVAWGETFAGGRGKILLGAEIAESSGVDRLDSRDWGNSPNTILNPEWTATNGLPRFLIVSDARNANAAYGGVINSPTRLRGIQFGPGGTPMPFTYGSLVTAAAMKGGDGVKMGGDLVLASPVKRHSEYGRISYELTNAITAWAEFGYAQTDVVNDSLLGNDQITIRRDNAFLPASIRTEMVANNIQSFVMGRSLLDYARGQVDITTRTWQGLIGLKGKLGGGWSFETSFASGRTQNNLLSPGNRITSRWTLALDAVVNPANGAIVCRSTLTDPTNGCVPLNLFGVGSASEAAKNWITGTGQRDWDIRQQVADLTLRGNPFSTWAGPVSVAFGGLYRRQSVDVTSDALSQAQAFRVGNSLPWEGELTVKEGFAEVLVPLAHDAGWVKDFDLSLGMRYADYSTGFNATTWKLGVNYAITDSIRLRMTRSRDIRAPNLDELFAGGSGLIQTVTDPVLNQTYSVTNRTGGNRDLRPEVADTLTAGIVFTPQFLSGFQLSVDYYNIRLNDAIGSLNAAATVTRCYTDTPQVCSLITRDPATNRITMIRTSPANFQRVETSGVDVELAYRFPLGGGRMNLRGLISYTGKLDLVDGANVSHFAGSTEQSTVNGVGGEPHWRFNGSAAYVGERHKLSLTGRYVGGGIISAENELSNYTDKKTVNGRLYLDVSGEITLLQHRRNRIALFGTIQNLMDTDPPITAVNGYGTTRSLYDMMGRVYTAGARFRF